MVADLKEGADPAPAAPARGSLLWRMTFPGRTDQAALVRRGIGKILGAHPDLDQIALVASELSANAVLHTRSGRPGGTFSVEVTETSGAGLMVAVIDEGAATGPRHVTPSETDDHFRGLQMVRALSDRFGVDGGAEGRTVWALFAPLGQESPVRTGRAGLA